MKKPVTASTFPHSPEKITVDWLNGVLRDAGVLTDGALESVNVQPTTAGFGALGSYARLYLRYKQALPGAPQSLFAKFSSDSPARRTGTMHMNNSEVCFYREVAPLVDLRVPRCYFASIDADSGHSLLLLEDLSAGRAGDALVGCSTEEAELLFRKIATFHAQWWSKPLLLKWEWLHGYDIDPTPLIERYSSAWPLFRQKYAEMLSGWVVDTAEQTIRHVPEFYRTLSTGSTTLIRGDLQLDNVMFDLPDARFALFDWQAIRRAPSAWDISWFLVRSLPIRQRREDENHLIRVYHEALVEEGVSSYTMETLRRHIKIGILLAFCMVINAGVNANFAGERGRRLITARIERNIAMLEDHDVWEALD